jgi:hypothetical protein
MEIRNSGDFYEDSGLRDLFQEMELRKFFDEKDYGNNSVALFFVICCIGENTKNIYRFDKKDQTLYWDVILSYKLVKEAEMQEKKRIFSQAIIDSFDILDKYKKLNLDKEKIKADAKLYFESLGWL